MGNRGACDSGPRLLVIIIIITMIIMMMMMIIMITTVTVFRAAVLLVVRAVTVTRTTSHLFETCGNDFSATLDFGLP
jgi:hypothetical protein